LVLELEVKKRQQNALLRKLTICEDSQKSDMRFFVQRVLNNNHPDYFYFHEEPSKDLSEPHCAFLSLSIALKAEHTKALIDAKILQLTEPFQHKLGYLVGQKYSRVGTVDWVPDHRTKEEFEEMVDDILKAQIFWVEKHLIRPLHSRFKNIMTSCAEPTKSRIAEEIETLRHETPSPSELALKRIVTILQSAGLTDPRLTQVRNQIAEEIRTRFPSPGSSEVLSRSDQTRE
jgi:hypothetical protein